MGCRSYDAYFYGFLKSWFSCGEASVGLVGIMAFDSVAYIVGEYRYLWHCAYIVFKRPLCYRQG